MANEKFTDLPTVVASTLGDIIAAVQGGVSVQQTLQQILNLSLANIVLNNAGDPNGVVAGVVYQFCWDKTNNILYTCTTSGSASTAVWTAAGSVSFPISVAHGGTGLTSTVNDAVFITGATGVPSWAALGAGQLLIGSGAGAPSAANLTPGSGISITNGNNTITISGTGSGIGWSDVLGTTQAMVADSGYVADNGSLVTLTLPSTASFGTAISIIGKGAGGWLIAQNTGQTVQVGSLASTTGAGGSVASTNRFDSIDLICTTANLVWTTLGAPQGNLTVV